MVALETGASSTTGTIEMVESYFANVFETDDRFTVKILVVY